MFLLTNLLSLWILLKKKIKILPYIDNDEYFYEKSGYPLKIMIWGAIAKDFKSPLILIDGKLNSIKYIKMLEDNNIFHLLNKRFGNNGYVFQQDGASSHTAAITINFLSQKVKLLKDDIKWPANSPDLNVIEIIWAIIKSRINIEKVENKKDLFEKVKQIWDEIPIETINLLIDSFHSRIKTCIQLNGESLNGKKKVMKKFGISYEEGNKSFEDKQLEKKSIEKFINESKYYFNCLSHLDMKNTQCNRLTCCESDRICRILPEKLLNKIKMPKPMRISTGKVYITE